MKNLTIGGVVLALCITVHANTSATACIPTGFNGWTAAMVNPGDVVGDVVNGTGCDMGIYYSGTDAKVQNTTVFGALHYGIMVHGDSTNTNVDILDSNINTIGDSPVNGNQRGVAIYYRAFYSTGTATGRVANNWVHDYQKGGIVVNGPGSNVQVQKNEVVGRGPVGFIAQNGIQFGYGAHGSAMKNTVTGHSYSGPDWSSGGILVVGGPGYGLCPDGNPCPYTTGIQIVQNEIGDNDVDAYLSNWDTAGPPPVATNIKVTNNVLTSTSCFNTGYTAAVSDVGNNDKIINNKIGAGYAICPTDYNPGALVIDADTSFTNRPKVHANK